MGVSNNTCESRSPRPKALGAGTGLVIRSLRRDENNRIVVDVAVRDNQPVTFLPKGRRLNGRCRYPK